MEHYFARKEIRQYNTNATFIRSSSAIVPTTGATVNNNVTRVVGGGVLVEEGTTNLIQAPFTFVNHASETGTAQWDSTNNYKIFGVGGEYGNAAFQVLSNHTSTSDINVISVSMAESIGVNRWLLKLIDINGNVIASGLAGWTYNIYYKAFFRQVENLKNLTLNLPSGVRRIGFGVFGGTGVYCSVEKLQIEARPYTTSFAVGARSPERLQIPISSVAPAQGTIDIELEVTAETKRQDGYRRIFNITRNAITNSGFLLLHSPTTASFTLQTINDSGVARDVGFLDSALPNGRRLISVSWDDTIIKLYIDGVFINSMPKDRFPSQFFHFDIGGFGGGSQNNSVYYNVRTSSRARTSAEILSSAQNGLLPDDDTTFLLFPPTYYITAKTDWKTTDSINFFDFNRIESNTSVVKSFVEYLQYTIPTITTVTNRNNTFTEFLNSINRLEQNIEDIKSNSFTPANYGGSETWVVGKGFDSSDANRIESNLVKLLVSGEQIYLSFVFAGQVSAGYQRGDLI